MDAILSPSSIQLLVSESKPSSSSYVYIEDSKRQQSSIANYNDDLLFLGCCCFNYPSYIPERNPVNIAATFIVVCWPYWSIPNTHNSTRKNTDRQTDRQKNKRRRFTRPSTSTFFFFFKLRPKQKKMTWTISDRLFPSIKVISTFAACVHQSWQFEMPAKDPSYAKNVKVERSSSR